MNQANTVVRTAIRVPGNWSHPGELIQRMPAGYRLTPDALILPDGAEIGFLPMPPDSQFAEIFRSSCRQPATDEEIQIVNSYTVNVGLTGPGGSMQAARTMMQAGAAIVSAGGAGVFIDNSVVAHGGGRWIEMADDGGPDALSFAFVGIVRGKREIWTVGMHVMGLPDIAMGHTDCDSHGEAIIGVIRYLCRSDKPIGAGHVLADDTGSQFQAAAISNNRFDARSPMYNPFGRFQLVSLKDIAERN